VEVTQNTLDELGFNWTVGNFANKALSLGLDGDNVSVATNLLLGSGLRTAATSFSAGTAASGALEIIRDNTFDWGLVIRALEQSDDADVLSAPSVTTRDGKTATIWVGEERNVPKSFAAKTMNTSPFIEHTDWEMELVGVQLEVTPELREGGLIDLELKPRVMDLIGEDSYVATPSNLFMSSVASAGVNTNPVTGSLPYFRIREMETQVTVADGSTLAMGGLIYDRTETFKDKVPLLGSIPYIGRLFRSEGEKTIKRNLMVFVTATEVDTNGRRVSDLAMKK
jgi:general secretion pathway protein D